jgi:hypothetical protein
MKKTLSTFTALTGCFLAFSAHALTQEELFTKLDHQNLMLKEEHSNLKSIENSSSFKWSAPELAISEMNANTPFFDSEMKMQRSIEISQMLPNPMMVSASNKIKANSKNIQDSQISITQKAVRAEAFKLFVGIYQNKKENEILTHQKSIVEKFNERLKSSQIQGQEDKIQVGEIQSELSELKLNLELNQNEYTRMKKMLNQLLNEAPDAELSDPILAEVSLDKNIDIQKNSELKMLDSRIDLMDSDLSMNKSQFFPEFSLKAKFNKSYTTAYEDSKEIMVGMTLPFLYWGQQSNALDSTHSKIEAMKFAKTNRLTMINTKADTLKSEIRDLILKINFLKESGLPIKEKKMKLFSNYSYTDMKTLMNYKMSFDDVYMLKMKLLEKEIELQNKFFEWSQLEG